MILDEPTSLIDSWGVIDWFDRFKKLSAHRTSILITHSLSIAKHADLIYVMDSGRIVESGTHDELLAMSGRYATSWQALFSSNPQLVDLSVKNKPASTNASVLLHGARASLRKVS